MHTYLVSTPMNATRTDPKPPNRPHGCKSADPSILTRLSYRWQSRHCPNTQTPKHPTHTQQQHTQKKPILRGLPNRLRPSDPQVYQ